MKKFKLKGNRVIGVPIGNFPYVKKGLIEIPIAFEKQNTLQPILIPVRILAIGDKFIWRNELKVGDIGYFSKYYGDELSSIRELVNEPKAKLYHGDDCLAYECTN